MKENCGKKQRDMNILKRYNAHCHVVLEDNDVGSYQLNRTFHVCFLLLLQLSSQLLHGRSSVITYLASNINQYEV